MSEEPKTFGDDDVEVISRNLAHDGFLSIEHIQLRHRLFSGEWSEVFKRELQLKDPAVGVLLFDPALDRILFVRQFRIGMLGESGIGMLGGIAMPCGAPHCGTGCGVP